MYKKIYRSVRLHQEHFKGEIFSNFRCKVNGTLQGPRLPTSLQEGDSHETVHDAKVRMKYIDDISHM